MRQNLFIISAALFVSTFTLTSKTYSADPTPMRVVSHFVTSGENLVHAKRVPMTKFSSQDYIAFFTALEWDEVTKSRGKQVVTWNWYRNGKLVSSVSKTLIFLHSPEELWSRRSASALGKGQFRVDVALNQSVIAANSFSIEH